MIEILDIDKKAEEILFWKKENIKIQVKGIARKSYACLFQMDDFRLSIRWSNE